MTNPYEASTEADGATPSSGRPLLLLGCGCAVVGLLGIAAMVAGFLFFLAVPMEDPGAAPMVPVPQEVQQASP